MIFWVLTIQTLEAEMTTPKFVDGYANSDYKHWSKLLDVLAIPYGVVVLDGYQPYLVYNLLRGQQALEEMTKQKLITPDEANEMKQAMLAAGISQYSVDLANKLRQYQLPETFKPTFNFEICTGACCSNPLAHGNIKRKDDGALIPHGSISTLKDGFEICEEGVRLGYMSKSNAILLFQQMLKADLANNKAHLLQRFNDLQEKTHHVVEAEETQPLTIIIEKGQSLTIIIK